MLQHLQRKKSSSLTQEFILGGACIMHHKINQSKRKLFQSKIDRSDKEGFSNSSDPILIDRQQRKSSANLLSSQKAKIKYLQKLQTDIASKDNEFNFKKNKMNKLLFQNNNQFNFPTQEASLIQNQKLQKLTRKRLKSVQRQSTSQKNYMLIAYQENQDDIKKSYKNIKKNILPLIQQKFRSYTNSNANSSNATSKSKNKIKKNIFFNSEKNQLKQSQNQTKIQKIKRNIQLKRPTLGFIENTQNRQICMPRNNTTKIERLNHQKQQKQQISNSQSTNPSTKVKSFSTSSTIKKIKKQSQSYKQIYKFLDQNIKKKDEKQKSNNAKFFIIRQEFGNVVNKTNQIQVVNEDSYFNAYIQKGNNGILVKELIKKRWWWHFSQENPIHSKQTGSTKQNPKVDKDNSIKDNIFSANIQNPLFNSQLQKKKVNLYWSQWFSKGFTQKLKQYEKTQIKLHTIYDQYQFPLPQQQAKYDSVKKITDSNTFNLLKDKISLRNANYFKNHMPKPMKNELFQPKTEGNTVDLRQNNFFKKIQSPHQMKIHNHIIGCLQLHSKKLLFKNLSTYFKKKNMDPFDFIPLTFYIETINSQNYKSFEQNFQKFQNLSKQDNNRNIWILKPGQNSNRGFGITVHKQKQQILQQLKKRLNESTDPTSNNSDQKTSQNTESCHIPPHPSKKGKKSVIIQKYIQNCFLINNRKFDFRCYILITTVNGLLKGYWYGNGYIRTSSEEYNLDDIYNKMIHLTNDAVQSKNSSFGKFEDYNKLSFEGFRKYLEKQNVPLSKFQDALKKMKKIAYYLIASVSPKIKRYQYTFELFGLDFMLDRDLNPYLIQANSNPCLDTKGPILTKIIRNLVQNVIMTAIDPLFPPPKNILPKKLKKQQLDKDYFQSNMFELIFSDNKSQNQQG